MPTPGWLESGSISFEWAKSAPTIFFTFIVGIVAGYIAYHHWRVAKAKLNLDLFEKRYAIFEATWTELSKAVQQGAPHISNSAFTNLFPKAEFLFGPEIREYMSEVSNRVTELWTIEQKVKANSQIMPADVIGRDAELLTWFSKHAMTECRARFGPYLDFKSWRS